MNNGGERNGKMVVVVVVVVHGGGGRRVSQAFVRRLAFWGWGKRRDSSRETLGRAKGKMKREGRRGVKIRSKDEQHSANCSTYQW